MEIIKLRHQVIEQALKTLENGLKELKGPILNDNPQLYKLMRDGLIQRFEYSIDTFWKFLKIYLESQQKITIEGPSPRVVLRLSLNSQLLNEDEFKILLNCISDRNLTSHSYNEEIAEKIQHQIPLYYTTMKNIIDKLRI